MESTLIIVRLVVALIVIIIAGAFTMQFMQGKWLSCIAKPHVNKKGTFYPGGTTDCAKQASWVMVACFAAVAGLGTFEMGKLADSPGIVTIGTLISNISLLAFCGLAIVLISRRSKQEGSPFHLGGDNTRLSLFLASWCVVLSLMSFLYV